jgi:hypothetical protein
MVENVTGLDARDRRDGLIDRLRSEQEYPSRVGLDARERLYTFINQIKSSFYNLIYIPMKRLVLYMLHPKKHNQINMTTNQTIYLNNNPCTLH